MSVVDEPNVTAESLGGIAMLAGVSLVARQELLTSARRRALKAGDVLIEQGARNDAMFIVLAGELAVHLDALDQDPLAVIAQGEIVGELSMLDGSGASAHVVARVDSHLLEVKEEDFWRLTNASHAFAVNLLIKLAARLRANNATVSKNVQKRRQYERAAMFDGLTGIHNRRWLDDTLHRMVRRHATSGGDLAVALLDVDHFKQFNDKFGHAAGDLVLTQVATTVAANLRPTDLVARFGGEEFVIIFPETTLAMAARASDRVRTAVADSKLRTADGADLPRVTISLGVAELRKDEAPADLLKRADMAMYDAKQGGRNRVVTARSHP
jgi:diguanylate cyclase (GGDEF)-like protein